MSWRAGLKRVGAILVVLALTIPGINFGTTVVAGADITQGLPVSGTTDVAGSAGFTDTLTATSTNATSVTFTSTTPGFTITNGDILNTPGTLSAADSPYLISGSDSDGVGPDSTWTYTLTVSPDTIVQGTPTAGSTDVAGSAGFATTLSAAASIGAPVTFTTSTPGFTIANDDELLSTGPLSADNSPYTISGIDTDAYGDDGAWSYQLTVSTDAIVQSPPTAGSTDVAGSAGFATTLSAAASIGAPVTFTTSTPGFTIANDDELLSTGPLSADNSPYTISGIDTDAYGDDGAWSYQLTVTRDSIIQGSPDSGNTAPGGSASFATTLSASSGSIGAVTFTTSTPGFAITNLDELENTGTLSEVDSPYTITGTDDDAYGDTGTWTYVLTVAASGGSSGSGTSIVQTSPTTGTVLDTASATFSSGPITVKNNSGPVTFVTTRPNPGLTVSASGLIAATGPLSVGTYNVSGTDHDIQGDTGTWTFTLTVTGVITTVTFNANGGSGTMSPESSDSPAALTLNGFAWAKHTFVDWTTSANGTGVHYANGAQYSFSASIELFAQWKVGKAPSRTITFAPNHGSGVMHSETDDTATAISPNRFTRAGYTFVGWNSSAHGSGKTYRAGAIYPFKISITLYAQWKKRPTRSSSIVTFNANGGRGVMAPESHRTPADLTLNRFLRNGYSFVNWNTAAAGTGASFVNGATYSFAASTTLFAQWKKLRKLTPPAPLPEGTKIGPFTSGTSTLSSTLEVQIQNLANQIKAKSERHISLTGYGDKLTAKQARNSSLWASNINLSRARAEAVASYLEGRLNSLGLKRWSISIAAAGGHDPGTLQVASDLVIASTT